MPAQGSGSHPILAVELEPGVRLEFDDGRPADPTALAQALAGPRGEAWSGVTTPSMTPFDLLHLWLAFALPGVCKVLVDPRLTALEDCPVRKVVGPAASSGGSFAYLTCRPVDEREPIDQGLWEFGARGFGPAAQSLAETVVKLVQTWDSSYRQGPAPCIIASPADSPAVGAAITKKHVSISTLWYEPGAVGTEEFPHRRLGFQA